MINKDPTQQYQKIIKQTLNQCNIIKKEHRWKYTNMNLTAPNLHATIKVNKQNTPIRPIINWKNAPASELAKQMSKMVHSHLHLPNTYIVQNSMHLITDLQAIEINKEMRLYSFHIENIYTNIPKNSIINIINNILENNNEIEKNTQKEITQRVKTVIEQNYFQFEQEYYK
jgi:hypothetical protein